MKKFIVLLTLFILIYGCDKYSEPSWEIYEEYVFDFVSSENLKTFAGEKVSDSIFFNAYRVKPSEDIPLKVVFDVMKGGGTLINGTSISSKNRNAFTGWILGKTSCEQILRAKVFNPDGKLVGSSLYTAWGFRENNWDTCTVYPDRNIREMVADTIRGVTFIVEGLRLYRQGERYFDWTSLDAVSNNYSFYDLDIDASGVLYATTVEGNILKSADDGITWQVCQKPFPAINTAFNTVIARDNSIWVSGWDYPVKFSTDGGATWSTAGNNLGSFGPAEVFSLKDGSYLYHGSTGSSLYRSVDKGLNWTKIQTPGLSVKLYVDENDSVYAEAQENGISLYRSGNYGKTFTRILNVLPAFQTTFHHNIFNRFRDTWYIMIPGYGILKSKDMKNFEDYYKNKDIGDLFIDHNGVLIAKGFMMNAVYYMKSR